MKRFWMYLVVLLVPFLVTAQTWEANSVAQFTEVPRQIQTADVDGDGDMDIAAGGTTTRGTVSWYEQVMTGNEIDWVEHVVTSTLDDVISTQCVDVDLDGDIDMVATSDYPTLLVTWYENVDGTGTSWQQWIITDLVREANGRFVGIGDMDGDGDNDAVISHWFWDHKIYWMENTDGLGQDWVQHMVLEQASMPGQIRIADFDHDNDLDFTTITESRLYWWENSGNGLVFTQHEIDPTQEYNSFGGIEVVDVNGDSHLDIVSTLTFLDQVIWWENDGSGANWTEHLITDFISHPSAMDVKDIDQDGDFDLSVTSSLDGVLYWIDNLTGTGSLWQLQVIDAGLDYCGDTDIADVDGDGLFDVLLAHDYNPAGISWYRQTNEFVPIDFVLAPDDDVTIPAYGATLEYDVHLTNNLDRPFYGATYWTKITLPNGNVIGPLFQQTFNLPAGANFHVSDLTQDIPGTAPAGDYTFHGYAGYFAGPYVTSSFWFMKHADATDGPVVTDWTAGGKIEVPDLASTPDLPQAFTLTNAWPNPFNAATSIEVTLPESAELTVTVFNTMGQQVAILANGSTSAGTHTLSFDASTLASGLYFIHATVPGKLNQVRKVMLVQ